MSDLLSAFALVLLWVLIAPALLAMLLIVIWVGTAVIWWIVRFVSWGVRSPRRR